MALVLGPAFLLLAGDLGGPSDPEFPPVGDYAALELYTRLAMDGRQLLGPYSRFGFHHPGPAYFYACVPLYALLGESFRGITLTAFLVNLAAAVGLLRLAARGGSGALLAAALALGLFVAARSPGWLYSAWNPSVAVLPFGFSLLAFAAYAAGARVLPLAVVAASFAAQTHLGCVPVLAASALLALLARFRRVRHLLGLPALHPDPRGRASAVLAIVLGALLWTPPLLEQLAPGGGNLGRIAGFAAGSGQDHGAREAVAAVAANALSFVTPGGTAALAGLGVLMLVVVAAYVMGRRHHRATVTALSATVLVAVAASAVAAQRITGPILGYIVRWMAMLTVAAATALGGALDLVGLRTGRAARHVVKLAGVALLLFVFVTNLRLAWGTLEQFPDPSPASEAAGRLAGGVASALARAGVRHPLVEVRQGANRDIALGFLLALDKRGVAWTVRPFGPFQLGGRWTPTGSEEATVVLGPEGSAEGGLLLAREAGQHAYLVRSGRS